MSARCLFGIFAVEKNASLVYRFHTPDLYAYLHQSFIDRGYAFDDDDQESTTSDFSIDDVIVQHFSTLMSFYNQTSYRKCPIRQITLESNVQVFFDQIGESRILCMTDDTYDAVVVLKTINLFKALVKFHLGALPFTKSKAVSKLSTRISASLQYYLSNVTTNQALLFESCEYLHINPVIRQQCLDACTTISEEVKLSLQTLPTFMLITCKDKIVYMHSSNDQNRLFSNDANRPSTSDLFLLLLNNTSRPVRNQFQAQKHRASNVIAHMFKTGASVPSQNLTNSIREPVGDIRLLQTRRTLSLPTFPRLEVARNNEGRRIEVIFMRTGTRALAPFTMYTIPLTSEISALILVEWKSSLACSDLSTLIHQLDIYKTQSRFVYKRINEYVRAVENNTAIRRYFESRKLRSNVLSSILNETLSVYKSLPKTIDVIDEEDQAGIRVITNLNRMTDYSIVAFHHLFFDSDEYALAMHPDEQHADLSTSEDSLLESPVIQILRSKLFEQLGDCFSFIEIKAQRNITMSFCHNDFPGLVHFAFIDRLRGQIYTPALYTDDFPHQMMSNEVEQVLEKKILAFELECLSALKRGCTSYTMTDEHFTYNYTLRLQESNGASMRLHKPFVEYQPPSILHFDFYKALAQENYSSLVDKTSIACFELICVHLRIVPSSHVREQCEQLWPRLMELDE